MSKITAVVILENTLEGLNNQISNHDSEIDYAKKRLDKALNSKEEAVKMKMDIERSLGILKNEKILCYISGENK